MRLATLCTAALLCVSAAHADTVLVVNRYGAYVIDTSANPPTITPLNVDRVVLDSSIGGPKPPGGDPDVNPPADATTQQIASLSKRHLQSAQEARALIATFDAMADLVKRGAMKITDVDRAIDASLPILSAQLKSGQRLKAWLAAVRELGGGSLDASLLAKGSAGLAIAWDVEAAEFRSMLAEARKLQAAGQTHEQAAQAAGDTEEAFDIAMILMIIQAIMELLKALGIIGG